MTTMPVVGRPREKYCFHPLQTEELGQIRASLTLLMKHGYIIVKDSRIKEVRVVARLRPFRCNPYTVTKM